MAYTKIGFTNGTTKVNADNMKHIEDGISNVITDNKQALVDLFYPVGTWYHTSDTTFNPNVSWGGTWVLDTDGTVLVSKSSTTGSKFNVAVGTVVGEETHTLTIDEMPKHRHGVGYTGTGANGNHAGHPGTDIEPDNYNNQLFINYSGGGLSHNNVQPSKVENRWHRTA